MFRLDLTLIRVLSTREGTMNSFQSLSFEGRAQRHNFVAITRIPLFTDKGLLFLRKVAKSSSHRDLVGPASSCTRSKWLLFLATCVCLFYLFFPLSFSFFRFEERVIKSIKSVEKVKMFVPRVVINRDEA